MNGFLANLDPEVTEAFQGLAHVVRGTPAPPAHIPGQRQAVDQPEEVGQVKLRRKQSRVPKPLRYAAGAVAIVALATTGAGRSDDAREKIVSWMRGR